MPVTPGAETVTFDSVVDDLAAAAADGGAIATAIATATPPTGLASLGGLDTTAFVKPTQANDMTSVDSETSCDGTGVFWTVAMSCECVDFWTGNPTWGGTGWTDLICTLRSSARQTYHSTWESSGGSACAPPLADRFRWSASLHTSPCAHMLLRPRLNTLTSDY